MAAQISGINTQGVDLAAHSATALQESATKARASEPKKAGIPVETDTVELSTSVKARLMKGQGESADEIADPLGVDVKTVESYLGSGSSSTETQARQMNERGESVVEIAGRLNVDVKTVERYLGNVHSSAAIQARKMKEEGESAVDIANQLHLDVKTVHLYLGNSSAADEQKSEKNIEG